MLNIRRICVQLPTRDRRGLVAGHDLKRKSQLGNQQGLQTYYANIQPIIQNKQENQALAGLMQSHKLVGMILYFAIWQKTISKIVKKYGILRMDFVA